MIRIFLALCAWFQLSLSAAAEAPASLLTQFIGEWSPSGEAFGAPAQSKMIWAPALGEKFLQIDYRIDMARASGPAVFSGVAYYQLGEGETLKAFWADNSGDLHPILATREGEALISHWGVEGGKQGRTRYELLAPDQMQVTDWINTPEGWRQFNHNSFARAAE